MKHLMTYMAAPLALALTLVVFVPVAVGQQLPDAVDVYDVNGALRNADVHLPPSAGCQFDCLELARWGRMPLLISRNLDGTAVLGVAFDQSGDPMSIEGQYAEGQFRVLDDWFSATLDLHSAPSGVAVIGTVRVYYSRDERGSLFMGAESRSMPPSAVSTTPVRQAWSAPPSRGRLCPRHSGPSAMMSNGPCQENCYMNPIPPEPSLPEPEDPCSGAGSVGERYHASPYCTAQRTMSGWSGQVHYEAQQFNSCGQVVGVLQSSIAFSDSDGCLTYHVQGVGTRTCSTKAGGRLNCSG